MWGLACKLANCVFVCICVCVLCDKQKTMINLISKSMSVVSIHVVQLFPTVSHKPTNACSMTVSKNMDLQKEKTDQLNKILL